MAGSVVGWTDMRTHFYHSMETLFFYETRNAADVLQLEKGSAQLMDRETGHLTRVQGRLITANQGLLVLYNVCNVQRE